MMRVWFLFVMVFTSACIQTESSKGVPQQDSLTFILNPSQPIKSISGEELPVLKISNRREKEAIARRAKEEFDANSDSLKSIVKYGRSLAMLGNFNEAINVFTDGLKKFPESHKLLRHRGEQFIIIRDFDKAIIDLLQSAFYARSEENEIEEDLIPNKINKSLHNTDFNIWYNLGLAYFLKGNYDKAISSYKKCVEVSDNNDLLVASSTWLYMTYLKIGNEESALKVLDTIKTRMKIVENQSFYRLLLLQKDQMRIEEILRRARKSDGSMEPTVGYGLANFYIKRGQLSDARDALEAVLLGPNWQDACYIAAEVEISNLSVPL